MRFDSITIWVTSNPWKCSSGGGGHITSYHVNRLLNRQRKLKSLLLPLSCFSVNLHLTLNFMITCNLCWAGAYLRGWIRQTKQQKAGSMV